MSYTKVNSPHAIKNDEIAKGDLPPSYEEAVLESICDPRDIAEKLIAKVHIRFRIFCKQSIFYSTYLHYTIIISFTAKENFNNV